MAAPLVQITGGTTSQLPASQPGSQPFARKPSWLKVKAPGGETYLQVKRLMRDLGLHTVCEEARCPNIGECWDHKAATFMILGDVCTRNCAYCAVSHGTPAASDPLEPARLAEAVAQMGLQHVVITSVDRDDLENGGAESFAGCVTEIRARCGDAATRRLGDSGTRRLGDSATRRLGDSAFVTTVELLIPDFKGSLGALEIVMAARPDILNHNLETCERLYRLARPGGRYDRALRLLANARRLAPDGLTKSGVILGLGEEWEEVLTCMRDLRRSDVNILTLGQYLRPSDSHLPVARYYRPEEFTELAEIGMDMGFTHVQASPLTRSSYHAWDQARAAGAREGREGVGRASFVS